MSTGCPKMKHLNCLVNLCFTSAHGRVGDVISVETGRYKPFKFRSRLSEFILHPYRCERHVYISYADCFRSSGVQVKIVLVVKTAQSHLSSLISYAGLFLGEMRTLLLISVDHFDTPTHRHINSTHATGPWIHEYAYTNVCVCVLARACIYVCVRNE